MKTLLHEDRLSTWVQLRQNLTTSLDPLQDIALYWSQTRLIPFNHSVDPYNQNAWPTPWEILEQDRYDDLTLAIMIGYTIKLTNRLSDSVVEIKSMVDSSRTRLYNLVYVDNERVLNYDRLTVVDSKDIPDSFLLENLVELARPR
tara:strand:+ start:159 stop:593 length:435 start_codon:yes stop_codon:yes gene_type:complete